MVLALYRVHLRKTLYQWEDSLCHNKYSVSTYLSSHFATDVGLHLVVSVDQTSNALLDGSVAGIMGLAFQSLASTKALPFWQALVNNNSWTSPEMSFWLTRFINDNNAQSEEPGGVLTLGGTNSSLFTGDIQFLNMPSDVTESFWLLQMSSAYGQHMPFETEAHNAIPHRYNRPRE